MVAPSLCPRISEIEALFNYYFTDAFSVYLLSTKAYRIMALWSSGYGDLRHVLLAIFFLLDIGNLIVLH
jgi:hypothetical protein